MKNCVHCGAVLNDEDMFCANCGQPFSEVPPQPVMPVFPEMPVYAQAPQAQPEAPVCEEPDPSQPAMPVFPEMPVYTQAPQAQPEAPICEEPVPPVAEAPPVPEVAFPEHAATPTEAPRKKGKGKLIALIIAGVLLIGAGVAAYFVASWYYSPEQKVLRMVEAREYTSAQNLVAQNYNLRFNVELETLVANRLDALKQEFTDKTVDYTAAIAELDSIEKIGMEGLKTRIPEYRTYIETVNQSRADFATAEKHFADGNYPQALEYFRKVDKIDPDYQKATQRITDTIEAYRAKVLSDAAVCVGAGNFTEAITTLEAGLIILPEDETLTQQKALYEQQRLDNIKEDAMSQAASAAANGDYVKAMEILDQHTAEYGANDEVTQKRSEYLESYVDTVLEQVDQLTRDKDFGGAITAIDDGLTVAPEHSRLTDRRKAVLEECVTDACDQADALAAEKQYEEALTVLAKALLVVTDDETLLAKKTEIEDKMGRWFVDLFDPYESSGYTEESIDMAGNSYQYSFRLISGHHATWNLNGEYAALSFDLGHIDGSSMSDCTVNIYFDGELHQSIEITADGLPQSYEIQVPGVKQLRISIVDDAILSPWCGFANVKIYK